MTKYCKHLTNIVQYEKRDGCRMCALEKEVSALAKANFKLHEALVIKDHENALKIAEVQKPAHNKQIMPCRMYAGVLEHCDVFGEGKCGCTPCQLAQA